MEVIVTVDASEGYLCAPGILGTLVGYAFVVAGEVVGFPVAAGECGPTFAYWVSEVTILSV